MEFQVGDKVMLKASPWKGVVHFEKRGKLNPRYVGPFKVFKKALSTGKLAVLHIPLHKTYEIHKLYLTFKCNVFPGDSPGYVNESDPEAEPEEDDEDPEEDPADRDDDDKEEEEEEHPALADSVPPVHRMTTRISIRDEPSISLPPWEGVERLLALNTPPPSPLTPLSSPLPHIPSPSFPSSPPASVLPASPPLQLLSSDHRTDRPEITLPPRKRLGNDLGPRSDDGEPRRLARVTELTAVQEQDTQDIYAVIEDTQDRQTQIYQSVETLFDDSQYHYKTARLLDQEALVSREAWGRSIEVSYMTRSEIMALRSVVMGQQAVISQLQAADRKSQVVTLEMLQADYQRQV
ncbi:hypothetical protein Tco_1043762 [Tanacetum coccineum]|uniref:Tf2-1-like SH3-like domain-containing protein n=1 Tax=Tanacetum coccineum TaxID=301880 RepID=A0ABQ5GQ00_9ASTR